MRTDEMHLLKNGGQKNYNDLQTEKRQFEFNHF